MQTDVSKQVHNFPMHIEHQPSWARFMLLFVLGYEGIGGIVGGVLLTIAPDGHLMEMPVSLMRGTFNDFLIPGIFLLGLGMLTLYSFFPVFRKKSSDWYWATLSLIGFVIWFQIEIIIVHELHWLHLMWGLPVLLAIIAAIPLLILRFNTEKMYRGLLLCGMASSLWYVVINIIVPMMDSRYSVVTFTVSELSAFGAPTRIPWVLMVIFYPLLFAAFGWGIFYSANENRKLRTTGVMIIAYCIFNLYWPPMHQRGVETSLSDTFHILWAFITVLMMMVMMGFGAAAFDKRFRIFTIISMILLFAFGMLTGMEAPNIPTNGPTPMIGIWERINIGIFMLWIVVLAIALLRKDTFLLSAAGGKNL